MKLTKTLELAGRYDRFVTDVNALLKRYRKEYPSMKQKKIPSDDGLSDHYIFFYKDEDATLWYVV